MEVARLAVGVEKAHGNPAFSIGYFNQSVRPDLPLQGVSVGVEWPLWRKAQKARVERLQLEAAAPANSRILLTPEQIKLAGIETGLPGKRLLRNYLECTGQIEVPPQNKASVHSPIQAFIQDVRFLEGDFVEKGTILAVLTHPDLVRLQREFLESKGRMTYLEEEWKRKGMCKKRSPCSHPRPFRQRTRSFASGHLRPGKDHHPG